MYFIFLQQVLNSGAEFVSKMIIAFIVIVILFVALMFAASKSDNHESDDNGLD